MICHKYRALDTFSRLFFQPFHPGIRHANGGSNATEGSHAMVSPSLTRMTFRHLTRRTMVCGNGRLCSLSQRRFALDQSLSTKPPLSSEFGYGPSSPKCTMAQAHRRKRCFLMENRCHVLVFAAFVQPPRRKQACLAREPAFQPSRPVGVARVAPPRCSLAHRNPPPSSSDSHTGTSCGKLTQASSCSVSRTLSCPCLARI